MRVSWAAFLLVFVSAACHRKEGAVTIAQSAVSRAETEVETLLEEHCNECHNEDTKTLRLGAGIPLTRHDAFLAALMVSGNRMPPPPADWAERDRRRLISVLCGAGARSAEEQRLCTGALSPSPELTYLRGTAELMRAMDDLVPRPQATAETAEVLLTKYAGPSTRVIIEDPTLEVIRVLVANERCPVAGAQGQEAVPVIEACLRTLLGAELGAVPSPTRPAVAPVGISR